MSSRILVKGLPRKISLQRFRSHFSTLADAQVTDARLANTADGRFRRFGFIGFRTPQQAQAAVDYFNGTFIDSSKISVELALQAHSDQLQRPWSKYSLNSSAYNKAHNLSFPDTFSSNSNTNTTTGINYITPDLDSGAQAADPKLQEFLAVTGNNKTTWGNDDVHLISDATTTFTPADAASKTTDDTGNNAEGIEKEDVSDLEYLRQKARQGISGDPDTAPPPPSPPSPIVKQPEDMIADTGRLYVRNITYTCTEDELSSLFQVYGPVAQVYIPIDRVSKQSKGYAFVLFLIPEHAIKAYAAVNGAIFQGRVLSISPAREQPQHQRQEDSSALSFKDKRQQERVKQATDGSDAKSWNSLFMNPDAIVSAMAEKLGVTKGEILDPTAKDAMGVRLALAETQIINETKAYLVEHGVSLDAFSRTSAGRSDTAILVKNIPYDTTLDELENRFSRFGTIIRVLLTPTRTVAVVEYAHANEAKGAFKNLAYSRFKSMPLYLEYAPVDTFSQPPPNTAVKPPAADAALTHPEPENEESATQPTATTSTLYIKNLNFSTTLEKLTHLASSIPGFTRARIAEKTYKTGRKASLGYAFIEFSDAESAGAGVRALQGVVLDEHALEVSYSRPAARTAPAAAGRGGTKLMIRNVPFEATKREIRQLFAQFSQVKAVRMPARKDGGAGTHRGYAFVEFSTAGECANAIESLQATHMYGRHLVIEMAEVDDESVDAARAKVRKAFVDADGEGMPAAAAAKKKRKVVLGGAGEME
ncbi:MAG: hypothetical protein SGCHY_004419 [Lobulomycetales sp.]